MKNNATTHTHYVNPLDPCTACLDRQLRAWFFAKVNKRGRGGCWIWVGAVNPVTGYGQLQVPLRFRGVLTDLVPKKYDYPHRLSVRLDGRDIPQDREIDHLCKVHACVNPGHLEVVSHHVNILRSDNAAALNARKAKCEKGHAFAAAKGKRYCPSCNRENGLARRRLGIPEGDPRHGTTTGYYNWACRCTECFAAYRRHYLSRKAS